MNAALWIFGGLLAANLVVLALGVAAARRKPAGAARPSAARERTRPMSDPVLLSLRTDQTDRPWQAAVLARARAYEAQAEAEISLAAYYAVQGARESAGEATEEAARYQQAAHANLVVLALGVAAARRNQRVPPAHPRRVNGHGR